MNYPHTKYPCSGEALAHAAGDGYRFDRVAAPVWAVRESQPVPAVADPRPARRMVPVNAELLSNPINQKLP